MTLQAMFFAIDCIDIFVASMLAFALLAAGQRIAGSKLAAFITFTSASCVVFSRAIYSGWIPEPFRFVLNEQVILSLQILMNTTPGAFMLLCFCLFQESTNRFPRWLLVLFAFQVGLEDLIPYLFGVTTHPSLMPTMTDTNTTLRMVFETLPAALQAVFVCAALYWTLKDWRADLVKLRRVTRVALLVVLGVNMVSYTLLVRLLLEPDDVLLFYVHEGYMAFSVVTNAILLSFVLYLRDRDDAPNPLAASDRNTPDPRLELDLAVFELAMSQHIYHETGLTIASLASRLNIPAHRLRRLINTKLGYRNFNHMLHAYRVAEASTALSDPVQRRLPILTIALSVGYQSINPFNRAFRDLKGTTPSAFRQDALLVAGATSNGNGTSA